MFPLLMRADLDRLPCAMTALYRNVDSIMIYHLLYPHYLGCAAAAVPQNGELAACGGCSWFLVLGSWFLVPGSWFLVLGSWFLVLRSSFFVVSRSCYLGFASTLATLAAWRELLDLNSNFQLELPPQAASHPCLSVLRSR